MADENLLAVVHRVIAARPDAVAYRTLTRNWTMREVGDASDRIAQGLKSLGIGPGDRVAALTKHTAECILLTLAACKVGAVFMPVNWRLAAPEIEFIVTDGGARFLMADTAFLQAVQKGRHPEALFVTDFGEPVSPEYLAAKVKRYMAFAGIDKPGSAHLFRHACATHMLEGGADIRFIQAMLGHADLSTTEIYTHVSIDKLQEIHAATHPARMERRQDARSNPGRTDLRQGAQDAASTLLAALEAEREEEG